MTTSKLPQSSRRNERGQTIVIALIVLGLLLILGFVFLGIINRNIQTSSRLQDRSESNDLAEAGARYAHAQLLQSEAGADWRGNPTGPVALSQNPASGDFGVTLDPDALYLRGPAMTAAGLELANPETNSVDRGGPDGLGPFFRVNFANGRALVRVRYGPSDANLFSSSPTGALRNPGSARNYLIIDSVGRVGKVDPNDPTTLNGGLRRQFRQFSSQNQFNLALAGMKRSEGDFANNRKLTAFVSLGIIDSARFITNFFRVTRAADIGIPDELGATYGGSNVSSLLSYQLGSADISAPGSAGNPVLGFGSIYVNADVMFHGQTVIYANGSLGDRVVSAGSIQGDPNATIRIARQDLTADRTAWNAPQTFNLVSANNAAASFSSTSPTFNTAEGILVDAVAQTDQGGYARGASYKTPPSLSVVDPETSENRYVQMTRESGTLVAGNNSGLYGHGRGIYVNNFSDRQTPSTEVGRAAVDEDQSLMYDWLNPNNGQSKSGWVGPYYVPVGSMIYLLSDGFTITRNSRAPVAERFWRNASGVSSGNSTIRYRLGRGSNGLLMAVNTLTPGIGSINGNLTASDFDKGYPFNGVVYCEGNVRVRGSIPTDVQLTIVSGATIYIEGSIAKGTTGNDLTSNYVSGNGDPTPTARGSRLNGRPSRSVLGLFAKDYVCVNPTMFFGPDSRQALEPVADNQGATNQNALRMKQDGGLAFQTEFLLDPNAGGAVNPNSPSTWNTFAIDYRDSITTSKRLNTKLLVTHTMDDGPATQSIFSLNINAGAFDSPVVVSAYHFPNTATDPSNGAADNSGNPSIPIYALGGETWQRFPAFESVAFDIIKPTTTTATADLLIASDAADPDNKYRLFNEGINDFLIRPNFQNGQAWNDYLLARTALVPHDIRIEAAIYAQEGSFFVIPGPWFNPNPNDRRDSYEARVTALGGDANARAVADSERQAAFGASRDIPFYGEPLDVRVVINGAVAENMPPPVSQQTESLKKWGWIPGQLAASGNNIPVAHTRGTAYSAATPVAPNFSVNYDPALATGKALGFAATNDPTGYVRNDWIDFNNDGIRQAGELIPLPPLPRMPVSPSLAFFGDVN
jgi:hypothetical protein